MQPVIWTRGHSMGRDPKSQPLISCRTLAGHPTGFPYLSACSTTCPTARFQPRVPLTHFNFSPVSCSFAGSVCPRAAHRCRALDRASLRTGTLLPPRSFGRAQSGAPTAAAPVCSRTGSPRGLRFPGTSLRKCSCSPVTRYCSPHI